MSAGEMSRSRQVARLADTVGTLMALRLSPMQIAAELIASGLRFSEDPYVSLVHEFHQVFGQGAADEADLTCQPRTTVRMRAALIEEEAAEAADAIRARDLPGAAKGLGDLLYVSFGAGVQFGIPLLECFQAVHASNMTKVDDGGEPSFRADGKVAKGPNYRPPDIAGVLQRQARMRALLIEAARVPTRPQVPQELRSARREQGSTEQGSTEQNGGRADE